MNDSAKIQRRESPRSTNMSFSKPEHARRRYEHYRELAENTREDRVARENYWQHAEHFFRVFTERAQH